MSVSSLSKSMLTKYKKKLCDEKKQTEEIINSINEIQKNGSKDNNGDSSSYTLHQADMGTDTDESEKRVYFLDKEIDKLKNINLALHRIYDKSYGICEICGEYISQNRLIIIPYARYCVNCKNKEETKRIRKR